MNLSRLSAIVILCGFGLLILEADTGLITLRDAAIPIGMMALGYFGLGVALLERRAMREERRLQRHKLPLGTKVMVIAPHATKGTYHIGDLAVIREHSWSPNKQMLFYRVDWISPPPPGIEPTERVHFLHPTEVAVHPSDPLFGTTSSTAALRNSSRTSKLV